MLPNERLELVHHSTARAERQLRLDPLLQRAETKLLQPRPLLLEQAPVGDVGKRRATPERQRLAQPLPRERRIASSYRLPPLVSQALEAVEVELVGLNPQAVSGSLSEKALISARGGCEPAPQARDVDLDHLRRALRRRLVPEQINQPVGRDALVSVQEQKRQEGPLLARPQRKRPPVAHDFERAQNPKLDCLGGRHLALRLTPLPGTF